MLTILGIENTLYAYIQVLTLTRKNMYDRLHKPENL